MAVSLRERIAVHEAAHAVVAALYGIPILSVGLDPANLHRGPCTTADHECLTTLCLAGIAAEEYFFGVPIPDPAAIQQDLRMARDACSRASANPLLVEVELQRARESAARVVRSEWGATRIARLSKALLRLGTLRGEEVAAFTAPDLFSPRQIELE